MSFAVLRVVSWFASTAGTLLLLLGTMLPLQGAHALSTTHQQAGASRQPLRPAVQDRDLNAAWQSYKRGALDAAFRSYSRAAERGRSIGQYNVAMMLFNGEGVAADAARARDWLARAARGGLAQAQYNQGLLYENGDGVTRSQAEATRWFQRAAEQGHADAQVSLATQYFLGRGVAKDEARAAHWYERAAKNGVAEAQYIIASCYEHGEGVKPDNKRAVYWYTQAGRQGDRAAAEKAKVLSAAAKVAPAPETGNAKPGARRS